MSASPVNPNPLGLPQPIPAHEVKPHSGFLRDGSRSPKPDRVFWKSTVPTDLLSLDDASEMSGFTKREICRWAARGLITLYAKDGKWIKGSAGRFTRVSWADLFRALPPSDIPVKYQPQPESGHPKRIAYLEQCARARAKRDARAALRANKGNPIINNLAPGDASHVETRTPSRAGADAALGLDAHLLDPGRVDYTKP